MRRTRSRGDRRDLPQCGGRACGGTVNLTDDRQFKAALRTAPPLDAAEICRKLGGGGHNGAAGATLEGDLTEVRRQVLDAVGEVLEEIDAGTSAS